MARRTPTQAVRERRKRAMQPLRDVLRRDERSGSWLARELRRRGFGVSQPSLSNYLNGQTRIAESVLQAACILACGNNAMAGDLLRDKILTTAGDTALLLQGAKE